MTVIYYGEGDHPAGFIGYRVATTLGRGGSYSQMYFSANTNTLASAKAKADAKDASWREEAEENIKQRRINERKDINYIAGNFRAVIRVRHDRLSTGPTKYAYPSFVVGSYTVRDFPIGNKYTFDEAFLLAVNEYCKMYGYDDEVKQLLISRKPEKRLFTGKLYHEAIRNEVPVSYKSLCERLDKQKEGTQQ